MKLEFLDRFSKNTQILNFTKIRPVEAELYHAGGETDGHGEANSRYSQSCNVPKNARCVVIFKVLCFLRPSRRDAGSLASCWFISYRIISVMNSTKRKKNDCRRVRLQIIHNRLTGQKEFQQGNIHVL